MINANLVFVVFLIIFGLIGAMRGWVREVIVTASLILALFVINQLGVRWNAIVNGIAGQYTSEQWLLQALPMFIIGFFGYLGPAVVRSRFEQNTRGKLEQGILAFIIGGINGYIIFSTLLFIAWRAGTLDHPPAPNQAPLFTPPPGGWGEFFFIKSAAISVLSGGTLVIVLIAVFLFVIVVIV